MQPMKKAATRRRGDETMLCGTCGNEPPPGAAVCPFCHSPLAPSAARKTGAAPLVTINLKQGLPTVAEAMTRLDRRMDTAILDGARVVRIIHGWGSGGKGGAIRDETRRRLAVFQRQHRIGTAIPGEDFSERSAAGRQLMERCPQLRDDRSNFGNPGITMVSLCAT